MRKTLITTVTVAALILAGLVLKVVITHSNVANAEASTQPTMSIYDLDVSHPNMKNLAVQKAPLP